MKRLSECCAATVLLVISAPCIVLAALAVKMTSRGPAFYAQTRVGKGGRTFRMYKLRTMVHNAEAATGPVWAKSDDVRVTRVGHILRKSHLDELPQLVNVIAGQMGLVGPRPERPEFVSYLEWEIPHYRERLNVRPGITGIAQLSLPPDSDLESVRRKLIYDVYYVRHVNPWFDVRILFFTGWKVIHSFVEMLWKAFRLPNRHDVDASVREVLDSEQMVLAEVGEWSR